METTDKTFAPIEPIHPTELIKDELQARGMQTKELAELLGMRASGLNQMLSAKESITPSMASKLEEALGIPAALWTNLQASYERDLAAARRSGKRQKPATARQSASTRFPATQIRL